MCSSSLACLFVIVSSEDTSEDVFVQVDFSAEDDLVDRVGTGSVNSKVCEDTDVHGGQFEVV